MILAFLGVVCTLDKEDKKQKFVTDRRIVSYTTSVSAMSRPEVIEDEEEDSEDEKPVLVSDFISPWNLALPNMSYGRHSHGIATIGIYLFILKITDIYTCKVCVCSFWRYS